MAIGRNVTVGDIERLDTGADEREAAFALDEGAFRAFYDRTARPLWAYLARLTGDGDLADELLQEAYYRFLRADAPLDDDSHRRNYLFRIATNLVRDGARRRACRPLAGAPADCDVPAGDDPVGRAERQGDVTRALALLKPRDRAVLWLAYAQGASHREIAETLGLRAGSVKPLLYRARQRCLSVLRAAGYTGGRREQA